MANDLVLFLLIVSWSTAMALCYFHFVITRNLLVLPLPRAMPRVMSDRDGAHLLFLVGAHILAWLPLSTQISAHTLNTFHASYKANWDEKPRIMEWKLYFTDFSYLNTLWKLCFEKLTFFSSFLLILTSGRTEEQQPRWREVRAVYQALWKQKGSSRSFQREQYVLASFLDTTPAIPASSAPPTLTHLKSRWKIFCQKTLKYSVRKLLS